MGPKDVAFDIHVRVWSVHTACGDLPADARMPVPRAQFCGICHSDLHTARGEWGPPNLPLVPGHELVGMVTKVGAEVTKFKVGDKVGVGCLVNSCRTCKHCKCGDEQYCNGKVFTYNTKLPDGRVTYGGYSTKMVCDQDFVLKFPDSIPLDKGAPLLCAGITVFAPMVKHGLNKPGVRLGVIGLGGLGHMAVKFGAAFGCEVTVISTSPAKEAEARAMGANHFLNSKDADAMKARAGSLDGIIDTVSDKHDVAAYMTLMDVHGKFVMVGAAPDPFALSSFPLIFGEYALIGSLIGGLPVTQQMLDFCGEKGVSCDVEVIPIDYVNKAYDRLMAKDVRYRFVIDMSTCKE